MKRFLYINIILITVFLSINLSGQNYNDALILSEPGLYTGARALSMGNSYSAISNDFKWVRYIHRNIFYRMHATIGFAS